MSMFAYGNTYTCGMEFNEDNYTVTKIGDFIVMVVADGNGGFKGGINTGSLAVSIAIDYLKHFINDTTTIDEIKNNLETAFYTVSRSFLSINSLDEKYHNIYSSMTIVVINEVFMKMTYATIGNTELRLVRDGTIHRVNKLFTEAYNMYIKNEISESEMYAHPKRAILTSALGVFDECPIEIGNLQLKKEDILLVMSDGPYRIMTPETMIEKLASKEDVKDGVEEVLKYCEKENCPDNCTLICGYIYDDNGATIKEDYSAFTNNSHSSESICSYEDIKKDSYNSYLQNQYIQDTANRYQENTVENDRKNYYNNIYDNSLEDDGRERKNKSQTKKKRYLYY